VEEDLHPRSLAWGIVRLEQQVRDYGPMRRRLWLPKLRGQDYVGGFHDFRIQTGGLVVFPRLRAVAESAPTGTDLAPGQISSGIAAVDTLLGGGLDRGTSAGLIGPPGCGKSTLACAFALAAARRGERAALYLFDESIDTFRLRAASQGLDLKTPTAAGLLSLRQVEPAELSPGELAAMLAREVESEGNRLVVVDSLSG
jgi:circadian clock protein KaiC